jgi:hypothetical protein
LDSRGWDENDFGKTSFEFVEERVGERMVALLSPKIVLALFNMFLAEALFNKSWFLLLKTEITIK